MATSQPPVIPEITKAYQNDPRTQLALAAMKAGTSTGPVAGYGYGIPDGIARVAQALAGTYINNQQEDKYVNGPNGQNDLLALRRQRGMDGLTGQGPAGVNPAAAPNVSDAIAQTLAGVGNQQPPQSMPPTMQTPQSAMPQSAMPQSAMSQPGMPQPATPPQAQGGVPMGNRPFPTGTVANGIVPAGIEPVPAAPAPVARPVAPEAVGPTQARTLQAAYRIMADANPYESAAGQDLYTQGLADQTKLDESAVERKQKLADMAYSSDLNNYASAQEQARGNTYTERQAAQQFNRQEQSRVSSESFTAGQNDKNRANEVNLANIKGRYEVLAAQTRAQAAATGGLTDDEQAAIQQAIKDKRLDPNSRLSKPQMKALAGALLKDPSIDAVHLHAYATMSASPAQQAKAMMIESAPDLVAQTRDAGKKLNFPDAQFLGKAQAYFKGQLSDPDMTNYMSKRADVVQTLAQIMRGTGATDKAVALENDAAPKTMTPRQFDAWASAQFDQLTPRVDAAEKRGLITSDTAAAIRAASSTYKNGGSPSAAPASSPPGWGAMTTRP